MPFTRRAETDWVVTQQLEGSAELPSRQLQSSVPPTCSIPGQCGDHRRLPVENMLDPHSQRRTMPDVISLCLGALLFK